MPSLWNPEEEEYVHYSLGSVLNDLVPDPVAEYNKSIIDQYKVVHGYAMPTLKKAPTKQVPPTTPAKNNKPLEARKGFKFGADPELFVKDPDGNIVCADMIPGTKENPHGVKFGAVQRDGFAAEYNIDPVTNFEDWNRNHKAVQGQLENMLPKGFTLVAVPAHRFSPEVFDAAPDEAKELGCMPDFNAWTGQLNPPPKLPDDPYLRCTGGHAHIGWTDDEDPTDVQHSLNCFDLTKQLDWFLGAWSVKHDPDTERRKLYGNAGSCRIKPYGVEYRVLSSFWVLDKDLRLQVWNRMQKAIEMMSGKFYPESSPPGYNDLVRHAIASGKLDRTLTQSFAFPINTLQLAA